MKVHTVISRLSAHGRLKFTGQKNEGGRLHGEAICTYKAYTTDHRIIKKRGWALTRENTVSLSGSCNMHPDRTIPQFKRACDRNFSARYVFQLITTHETNLSRVANLLIKYSGLTLKW